MQSSLDDVLAGMIKTARLKCRKSHSAMAEMGEER